MSTTLQTSTNIASRTVSKIRWRLLPYMLMMYIIAMVDRVNIGFAKQAMQDDLGINPEQFGFLAGIFFIGYFLVEVPSNIAMHRVGAKRWIARILISWGIIAALTGFTRSANELYVIRFLLGVAEGGFFPGMILYITYWFPQRERAASIAIFMMALPLSGIIGSPISGLILENIHWYGISSWRWMLVLEAVPAIILGFATFWLLPNKPEEAKFLEPEEQQWLIAELDAENKGIANTHGSSSILAGIANLRVWYFAVIYFLSVVGVYALSFWIPTIIKELSSSYTNSTIGFIAIIPHTCGLIAMNIISRNSDRTGERGYHAGIPLIIGGLATIVVAKVGNPILSIGCLSLMAVGIYNFYGPFWVLPSRMLTGYAAASGIAIITAIGNLGGFASPVIIGSITKKTGSMFWGMVVAGICMLLAAIMTIGSTYFKDNVEKNDFRK